MARPRARPRPRCGCRRTRSVVARLERADRDHHVDLARAVAQGAARLERLHLRAAWRRAGSRSTVHTTRLTRAAEPLGAAADVHRVHADAREAVLVGLVAEPVDVGVRRLGPEQGVVDEAGQVLRDRRRCRATPMRRTSRAPPMNERTVSVRFETQWPQPTHWPPTQWTGAPPCVAEEGREERRVRRQHLHDGLDERLVVAGGRCHGRALPRRRCRGRGDAAARVERVDHRDAALVAVETTVGGEEDVNDLQRGLLAQVARAERDRRSRRCAPARSSPWPRRRPCPSGRRGPCWPPCRSRCRRRRRSTPRHASPRATASAAARAKTG